MSPTPQQILLRPGENHTVAPVDEAAPLVMVLPTRRDTAESRRRWQHFLDTAARVRPVAALILDNTPGRSATTFVQGATSTGDLRVACLSDVTGPTDTLLIYRVRLATGLRILMVHDDDWWERASDERIELTSDAAVLLTRIGAGQVAFPPGLVERWGWGRPFDGSSHMHSYFGAIRGDVWNRFADYAVLTSRPSAFLDVALDFALQAVGNCAVLDGYTYQYSPGNWSTPAEIRGNYAHYTEVSGWGALAGVEAAVVERRLDALAMIALFHPPDAPDRRRALIDSVFSPPPAPRGMSSLAARIPEKLKLGMRATRMDSFSGLTLSHLRDLPAAVRSEGRVLDAHRRRLVDDPAFASLVTVSRLESLERLATEGLSSLRAIAPTTMTDRISVWERQINLLLAG